ncbi:MAG: putative membrane protein [Halioglobus sp.]|jgi:uncharacterized membrane protein
MPDMTLLGWAHTIIAILALVAGFYTLAMYKVIKPENRSGQLYLVCTFLAAISALMIYNQGGFGPAHMLAILTLLALLGGILVDKVPIFSTIAHYFQAFCFSGTLLFHMIPAITDGLLRLPIGDPFLTDKHDPLLRNFYLLFVVVFLLGFAAQFIWLKNNGARRSAS